MKQFADEPIKQSISPAFDFIHQGGEDSYGLPTEYTKTPEGIELFRGKITIRRDNEGSYRDGLAYIVPHFKNDCSDVASIVGAESVEFVRDDHNIVVSGISTAVSETVDPFADERDISGKVHYQISIRPEDPYFIFGDPNYHLGEQNE